MTATTVILAFRLVIGFLYAVHAVMPFGAFGWTARAWSRPSGACRGWWAASSWWGAVPVLNQGEPAALYSWVFLLLVAIGPGRYAVDPLRRR